MKFDFNEKFLKSLNEILDSRFKSLQKYIQANYVPCDDVLYKEDTEERISELESRINCDELVKQLSEREGGFLTRDSVDERILEEIETRCLTEFDLEVLESRIEDLENEENDIHALKILRDDQERRILTLESENQQVKERLLTLENFILKTLKGFKDD